MRTRTTRTTLTLALTLALTAAIAGGCEGDGGGSDGAAERELVPHVAALEADRLVVGQTLRFYGANFLHPDEGTTYLEFDGVFVWTDAAGNPVPEDVQGFRIQPIYDGAFPEGGTLHGDTPLPADTRVLRWNRFGPFQVPFGQDGARPGTFSGTVRAVNVYEDGAEYRDPEPLAVTVDVGPSILIRTLEPVIGYSEETGLRTAQCGAPALRALSGLPYVLEVEAMGFEPSYFIYEITNVNGVEQPVRFTHTARGAVDRLGDPSWYEGEIFAFNPLGDNEEFAIAAIRVTAVAADNTHYETALPLTVVRPLHFFYDGRRELAEYYEPELVHGPIVGGLGTTVTYAESHSESRQRGVSVSVSQTFTQSQGRVVSQNWNEAFSESSTVSSTNTVGQSHSEAETASETYGTSYSSGETSQVNFASTDGTTWGWDLVEGQSSETYQEQMQQAYGEVSASVTTEVSGEASVPGVAKVGGKVGTTVGATVGASQGQTEGARVGQSTSHGTHMGGTTSDTVAYGSTTTDTRSESMSGTYALSSQSSISSSTAETTASSESTTYSMGGSEGLTENYTVGSSETWQETWVTTSTDQSLLSFTGKVPRGRCAAVYRQTVRHVRVAQLYSYDLCGVRSLVGELHFNEWSWTPNIAIGEDCDDGIPPSTLPAAACFVACD